jgi:hypothetical protein
VSRYTHITTAAFGDTNLPLPMWVKLSRHCQPLPAAGDNQRFASSVQLATPTISAAIQIRGTAVAESLSLGTEGDLVFAVLPAKSMIKARKITLHGAVLHAVELAYDQSEMACAVLRFVAACADGNTDPVIAEDLP